MLSAGGTVGMAGTAGTGGMADTAGTLGTLRVRVEGERRMRLASGKVARPLSSRSHRPSYQPYQPFQPPYKVLQEKRESV